MFFALLHNWRHVKVTPHRTRRDWAFCIQDLLYEHFPQAERCILVQDNLNTHDLAGLYEVFPPAQAKSMLDRLEFRFTPKHGSWLNMAEIELSVVSRQCLNGYVPSMLALIEEVAAWEDERNTQQATVDWRFTSDDARIKLKKLYPIVLPIDNVKEPLLIKP